MLKHSISHYGGNTTATGTEGGGLIPIHHSSDGSNSIARDQQLQLQRERDRLNHQEQNLRYLSQVQPNPQIVLDPTRYLEGHVSPQTNPEFQNYLEHGSYPNIHSTSRIPYLESSRSSRGGDGRGHGQYHRQVSSQLTTPISPIPKQNGSLIGSSTMPRLPTRQFSTIQQNTGPSTVTGGLTTEGGGINVPPVGATIGHSSSSAFRHGVLRSLALLSILSLLLALNSLIFLLKIVWPLNMSGGNDSEFKIMYEVTLCLSAMCLSISLCVLLVTSAQYFFAISGSSGTTSFLHKVTFIRGIATGGFFLSIPLFLAAIVFYTFTHLSFAIPALVTTLIVALAIIFGGCAMVYHVFTWQKGKTNKRILHEPSSSPNVELSTLV